MENKNFLCIIEEEMDSLWFHKLIFFSQPSPTASVLSLPSPLDEEKPITTSESISCSSSIISSPPPPDEETSTDESPSSVKQLSSKSIFVPLQDGSNNNEEETKERLGRMELLLGNKTRSHSSSPSTQDRRRKLIKPVICARKLQKSISCRTFGELELDEVKGFMDLGFTFNKEYLSPRMMSVVPGLQRLGVTNGKETVEGDFIEAEEEKRDIMRPYLSEAWLIKRPDSPLLNLKIPKRCSSSNMKKHLRFWAKTVASEIHQE
ncbi:unnamed protein product [Sphenostylis stenocarpa]|uniref:Uncharacterized protein n=1 Tax=Sphenostylis stenocarpa TaxID=92480 RepID=A0AA86RZD9_9FABA|nr:unnamed protein product [Sphenostylis stenocarpa]